MRTHYVATVPLDSARLAKELELSMAFHWSDAYSDYVFGGAWKSCVLWAPGGDAGDGVVTNYQYGEPPGFTEYGSQLPYLHELISTTADLTRLNFVRLAMVSNSVIIPHRDLLELGELDDETRNAHRMHIPLATNDKCFFSEGNTVYQMRAGEVWFLDAARIHSAASLSNEPRIHLMLDFVNTAEPAPLTTVDGATPDAGIPASRIVTRPRLTGTDRAALMRLAGVLTMETFGEIFSIVIKTHYRHDGGDHFVWQTMTALARDCADPAVLPHTLELLRYFTLERSA